MRNDALFSYAKDDYNRFFYTINRKNYLFRATLVNADGVIVDFQKGAIKELYIHDLIYNPFISGYILIDNTEDVIERYKTPPTNVEFNNAAGFRGYKTRGDARDLLFLSIIPVEPSTNPYNVQSLSFNRLFGFQYVFALSNEQDVPSNTGKYKKYDLIDFDEEVLREKKIFFSTAKLIKGSNVAYLSDKNRQAYTGECIKYILKEGLESSVINTILSGGQEVTPQFESGSSKVFYSSPNDNSALDDLNYLYNLHVSNSPAKDFSYLKKDDYTGEYTLQSVSDMFSMAFDKSNDSGGPLFIENITIAGAQNEGNVVENDIKKPLNALEFGEQGDVIDIKFYNTPGTLYQEKIRTILVNSYTFQQKTFNINAVDGDVQNVKNDFTKFYVQPMKGKDNKPFPNFIVNNTQKTNKNYDNVVLPYSEESDFLRLSLGRNQILKNALNVNLGVEITTQGGFQRMTGKFISIDRKGSYVDNDFDNKFLGIYFVISVEHQFVNDNSYINKIIAVKTYHFNDPKIQENIP